MAADRCQRGIPPLSSDVDQLPPALPHLLTPPPPEDGLLLTSAGLAAASSDFLASSLAS